MSNFQGLFGELHSATSHLSEALTRRMIARRMQAYEMPLFLLASQYFDAQGIIYASTFRRTTNKLTEVDKEQKWVELFSSTEVALDLRYAPKFAKLLQRIYYNGSLDASRDYALKLSFTLKNPRAVSYAKERATELLREINDTTRQEIKDLIVEMLDNGESYQSVARSIKSRFADYSRKLPQKHLVNRAELVAVTEAANAYQTANFAMIKSAVGTGLEFKKSWLTVGDNRVSPGCQSNAAEGYIALDDSFSSGHAHPPRFPGCRCSAIYQRD